MFTHWLRRYAKPAESWARSTAPSGGIDPLIRVIIRRDFDRHPELAMEWAHLLQDPDVRMRVQTTAGRSWYQKDSEAFMAWLPESGLESRIRDLILNTPMKYRANAPKGGTGSPGETAP
jgi:hypothetical protein